MKRYKVELKRPMSSSTWFCSESLLKIHLVLGNKGGSHRLCVGAAGLGVGWGWGEDGADRGAALTHTYTLGPAAQGPVGPVLNHLKGMDVFRHL